ncbi:riboflavin synthase [Aliifodinibius salipaludis]|uniref:Riboflavin synthase n=1 Tax=Fodinibius salipaludis TaxID=2032627 RepID=A0A2A2GCR5_9BACT|nr:riboflavin synthase [Aliifodinibius salipaludis]PAU95158.1 riboflavin synthase [Aliifodinibius salipaludis]
MFTGIIKSVGQIETITSLEDGKEITIASDFADEVSIDQSISINGVCHTATACDAETFTVQSVAETLRKTNIGDLQKDDSVNLERSLRPDQLLDGHIVQGHVDATGTIKNIDQEGTDWLFTIEYPKEHSNLIVGRGSIAIDGISLTVANEQDNTFTVAIIPYTYEHTNLNAKEVGDTVNLEFDVLGKYVVKYLENRGI